MKSYETKIRLYHIRTDYRSVGAYEHNGKVIVHAYDRHRDIPIAELPERNVVPICYPVINGVVVICVPKEVWRSCIAD